MATSYDDHIKSLIEKAKENVDKVVILDLENGKKLSTDKNKNELVIKDDEVKDIIKVMKEGEYKKFKDDGFTAAGIKYRLLTGDPGMALGRSEEQGGISMQTTQKVIVIATTADGMSLAKCDMAVGDVKSAIRAEERKADLEAFEKEIKEELAVAEESNEKKEDNSKEEVKK